MKRTTPARTMQLYDTWVSDLIAKKLDVDMNKGLEIFLNSKTHELLLDDELKLWYFSPNVIFDMWENEIATGNPCDSLYISGDEFAVR